MTIDELKQAIEAKVGIPANLLTGETVEENIAQAKALLAYKKEADAERPRTTAEQFSAWIDAQAGNEQIDTAGMALASIEDAARVNAGGYPRINDGGEMSKAGTDPRPASEQFAEWFGQKTALNPFKDRQGW